MVLHLVKSKIKLCITVSRSRLSPLFCTGAWPMPDDERVKQAVCLVLLLLPPANRRKLHLLLRFLSKVKANTELQLADSPDALQTLVRLFCFQNYFSLSKESVLIYLYCSICISKEVEYKEIVNNVTLADTLKDLCIPQIQFYVSQE